MLKRSTNGRRLDDFGVYFDPTKSTSGQRFYKSLCETLAPSAVPLEQKPNVVLFNVSAPITEIAKAKLRRQKVVLRVDGLYADRLSSAFVSKFNWPLRRMLSASLRYPAAEPVFTHLANFVDENYAAFGRILMADLVIYQSAYCRTVHAGYFPRKAHRVIVNGASYCGKHVERRIAAVSDPIRLVTIYDAYMPRKRIYDLVRFVSWACSTRSAPLHLTLLGYTGQVPKFVPPDMKDLIENSPFIRTVPAFKSFDQSLRAILLESDAYVTFSFRDPCPNAVIEGMAHGLPVVAVASGGIPDIVGDAGVLLPDTDKPERFFSTLRYGCDFPPVDYQRVLEAILEVKKNALFYRNRVRQRFVDDLGLDVVAARYVSAIRTVNVPSTVWTGWISGKISSLLKILGSKAE